MAVFWWNAAGAVAAVVANAYAALRGDPKLSALRTSIAALAAFYALGYFLVIFHGWDVTEWSEFYRKAAIAVWPVAWTAPAVLGARTYQRTKRALERVRGEP